jgi:hypothetical protein
MYLHFLHTATHHPLTVSFVALSKNAHSPPVDAHITLSSSERHRYTRCPSAFAFSSLPDE